MKIFEADICGLFIVEPKVFDDERGYFFESFREDILQKSIGKVDFVQDNESYSKFGVIRGLHFQLLPYSQSKLVRVVSGKILDIALDLRKNSSSYGRYFSVELSSDNKKQLFIPQGFAHGFSVLSESAVVQYKVDNYYSKEHESGINPLDLDLHMEWQLENSQMLLSQKDRCLPSFKEFDEV